MEESYIWQPREKLSLSSYLIFFREFFTSLCSREHTFSIAIICMTLIIVLSGWVAIYLLDVQNIYGISSNEGFWWHIFRDGGPIEFVQWGFLALTCCFSAALFGFHYARGEREASVFWGLVTVSFVLMLIEDAGNPRHRIAFYLVNYLGWSRLAIEGTLYVLISFPIIIAFLRYWKVPFIYPQTRLYLLTGAFLYGVAASSSVFRFQDDYYYDLGDKISDLLLEGVVPGFWLMDYVIEEAVELLAAATSNSTANGACSFIVQNFF